VVALVVAGLAVVMSPLPATAAPPPAPVPTPVPAADKHGSGSEMGDALEKARDSRAPVEVVGQRTPRSTTLANPDGTVTMEMTQANTRRQLKDGSWAALDATLAPVKGRLAPRSASAAVSIRATGSATPAGETAAGTDDVVNLDPPGAANISMGFASNLPTPTVAGDTATFALGGGAVLTTEALDEGFRADVVLSTRPSQEPTYRFPIEVAGGLTPRLQDHTLQFIDTKGDIVATSAPLQAWDAQRDAAGDPSNVVDLGARLTRDADGWVLALTAPTDFLGAASTRYPVVVDPTVTLADQDDSSNTWYYDDNPTDRTDTYYLSVGKSTSGADVHRSYIKFNTGWFTGKTITNATMRLFQYNAGSCDPRGVAIYPTTGPSHLDASNVEKDTNAAWASKPSFNTGGDSGGCTPNGYVGIDVTKTVTGWTTGEFQAQHKGIPADPDAQPAQQYGMEMQAANETDLSYYKRFCSEVSAPSGTGHCEGTNGTPQLSVTYVPDLGIQSSYEMFTHKLNDRSQLSVNTRYGNAALRASDVHVASSAYDLNLDRFYNSQNTLSGQFGVGWSLSLGPDVRLQQYYTGNDDRFIYIAPGGTRYGPFVRKTATDKTKEFYDPEYGGVNADLNQDADTGNYTLKFDKSQEEYTFSGFGCTTCDKLLTLAKDRNGKTLTFNYTNKVLTNIVDTQGRKFLVAHNTAGLVTSISEDPAATYTTSPRTWTYGYTGNQLTSYTDPTGKTTNYAYTGSFMTLVTDPAKSDGNRPTTRLAYTGSGQATQLDYFTNAAGTSYKRFTFAYSSDRAANDAVCNNGHDDGRWWFRGDVTNASDPQGGTTRYCYQDRDLVLDSSDPDYHAPRQRTMDPLKHKRTISFSPNNDVTTGSGGGDNAATQGTTVYSYNLNNSLSKVTQPKDDASSSNTAGTTTFDYAHTNTVAGGSFLPSSVSTSSASCSSMAYDDNGNMTDTWTGMSGTGTNNTCSADHSGKHHEVVYFDKDTTPALLRYLPHYAKSPESTGSGQGPDDDWTWYGYYDAATDAPNVGMLRQVVKPGGNGGAGDTACSTNRTLCTSYTYDSRSRVRSVRDGNNRLTTYSYDANDRTIQVLTNGATTCSPSAGTCVQYAWDGEGNLASRIDVKGTTTFTYNWLNQPATQTQPDGTVLTTTYDGAGNLTQYKQQLPGQSSADVVNYTYDAANELLSIVDSTGTYSYTYDSDARPTKMTLPSASGVSIAYTYTGSGKPKKITPSGGTGLPSYTYSYDNGGKDTKQLRKIEYGGAASGSIVYRYNGDDQLSEADPSSGDSWFYSYDKNANLTQARLGSSTATTSRTYYGYNASNQLCWKGPNDGTKMSRACGATPSGNTTYVRDGQGNNRGTTAGPIVYNVNNQVSSITNLDGTGGAVSMSYFDQGNNLRAAEGATALTGGTKLGVTSRRSSAGITYYTRDPYGQVVNTRGTGGTYFYMLDRQGTVTTLINAIGAKAGSYTYDPYGKTTVVAGSSSTAAQNSPWRYTGGYQDSVDGYYHFGARYYDSAGHFNQGDPVAGSLSRPEKYNSYFYASSDPINNTDLSGEATAGAVIGLTLGVIGLAAVVIASGGIGGVAVGAAFTGGALTSAQVGATLGLVVGVAGTTLAGVCTLDHGPNSSC
jgi:RHS repeat-associated protein